jgi:phosphate transport system substrate-binding protein
VQNGTYRPLSRPIFIYVKASEADRPEVVAFVDFYLASQNVRELVAEVGYIPFPEDVYALARQRWESRRTGTTFSAQSATIPVAELLRR